MLAECEAGNIDIILTKSISRFARNTVDLLETVRHLKELGIEVQFEKEHISSLSDDGELMLSLLASFAQEEVRSLSENVKWGTRKRMQQGIPNGHFRVYGYRWEGDVLVPIPEEAAIVRRIFQNFLDGKSRLETEHEFAAEGITTREGCRWVDSNIKVVLTNVTYTGSLLLQKEYITDPITKKRKKNRGELPQYYVPDTHEAIIDRETFDYVQSDSIISDMVNKASSRKMIPLTDSQLRIVQALKLRDKVSADELMQAGNAMEGNISGLAILQEIAQKSGVTHYFIADANGIAGETLNQAIREMKQRCYTTISSDGSNRAQRLAAEYHARHYDSGTVDADNLAPMEPFKNEADFLSRMLMSGVNANDFADAVN